MKRVVYMMITKDKYELPMVVADTPRELASICGVSPSSISHQVLRREAGTLKHRSKYVRVIIDDEEDPA